MLKYIFAAAFALTAAAQEPKIDGFDYYLLSLSWAPDFCAQPGGQKDVRECGKGRNVGFVVHGLWPQGEQGRGPERCGNPRPVAGNIVQAMLAYIPTPSLIQHEWSDHGTCTGLSAADYFAQIRKARDSVKLPAEFQAPHQPADLAPADIEAKFAAANANFPRDAFRTSCTNNALQEVRICLNKDLSPRGCTPSAGECRMRTMLVRPVQ
jgi:ribonuclease T2